MSRSTVTVTTHEVSLDEFCTRAFARAGATISEGENVVIQFTMFRSGAVSEAAVLDSGETPHELDPVAAVQLLNEIPELQRVDQTDAISMEATKALHRKDSDDASDRPP